MLKKKASRVFDSMIGLAQRSLESEGFLLFCFVWFFPATKVQSLSSVP